MQGLSPDFVDHRIGKLKVLVIDDNQSMRKLLRAMLAAIGIKTVFEAGNGLAGLDLIPTENPNLVIVDWEMPMLDGLEFLRMVRSPQDFPNPEIPIIVSTGHADHWRVVEAARSGAHEFLLKPVSIKVLRDHIMAIIRRPRPTVTLDGYYGPMPRRIVAI